MTIALGFLCRDGLVLGADTLLSSEIKQYDHKVWLHPDSSDAWSVAVAGAGNDFIHIRNAKDALFEAISAGTDLDHCRGVVHRAVAEYYQQHAFPDPHHQQGDFALVVGLRVGEAVALLQNSGSMCADVSKSYACIGSGSPIGSYLIERYVKPGLSLRTAKMIASYTIDQAIQRAPGCGGFPDIVTVPTGATLPTRGHPLTWVDPSEEFIGHLHGLLDMTIHAGFDDPVYRASKPFEAQLAALTEYARQGYAVSQKGPYNWLLDFNQKARAVEQDREAEIERRVAERLAQKKGKRSKKKPSK